MVHFIFFSVFLAIKYIKFQFVISYHFKSPFYTPIFMPVAEFEHMLAYSLMNIWILASHTFHGLKFLYDNFFLIVKPFSKHIFGWHHYLHWWQSFSCCSPKLMNVPFYLYGRFNHPRVGLSKEPLCCRSCYCWKHHLSNIQFTKLLPCITT